MYLTVYTQPWKGPKAILVPSQRMRQSQKDRGLQLVKLLVFGQLGLRGPQPRISDPKVPTGSTKFTMHVL